MSKLSIALLAGLAAFNAQALTAGSLAFTSFNADEDGFSMVALTDITANTTVFFSDNEWNGSAIGAGGAFNTGESYMQWATGTSVINAGTVVRFSSVDSASLMAASVGTFSRVSVASNTNWGLAASTETLYAYQGTSATAPTSFIAAVTNGSFASDGSLAGTGLVEGQTAIRLNTHVPTATPDYGVYTGTRTGKTNFADYLPLVNNPGNWQVDTTNGNYATTVPNTTAFTVAAVPEPESWALALAGLGVCALLTRRQGRRQG